MIIAITGANGHVGVNLCKALAEQGHEVRALVHEHASGLEKLNVTLHRGDLLERSSLIPFIKGAEIVFHLAARISITGDKEGGVRAVNTEGTRNMVELSREYGIRRFIHFSSIHAFCHDPQNEELDETRPLVGDEAFAYDRSKADGERIVMEAARNGFDAFVLSPTAIIGPMDFEPSLMGKAFLQLYHHQIPALVPGGYNWVDVRDVVQASILAIEKGRTGEKYLLSGKWHSLPEVAALIRKHTGRKIVSTVMPFWLAWTGLPFITLFSRISGRVPLYTSESLKIISKASKRISHKKAVAELGFSPRSLDETVRDTMDWFKKNGFLN
ncbi:MAG: NAD-dependent epimerase/dehydratase family protein [Bacteroidetes bacterium]|nr:NAD-dependent epimerase/dehydratase family protein [Bacteroidota bacterium]